MSGYDPQTVIQHTHDRLGFILIAAAVAVAGGYMQYLGAMRRGARDRSYSIPLATNLWNLAHDTTFVGNFHTWFRGNYQFWLDQGLWFGLIVFSAFEVVVIVQILRYARQDLFGGRSLAEAVGIYVVLQLMVYGIFWWFRDITDDPLEYYGLITTVILASAFNIPMMRARGSRRGMSEFILWGYLLLSVGFWPWMMLSDDYFCRPIFWLIAVGNIAVCVESIRVYRGLPEWSGVPSAVPAPPQLIRDGGERSERGAAR